MPSLSALGGSPAAPKPVRQLTTSPVPTIAAAGAVAPAAVAAGPAAVAAVPAPISSEPVPGITKTIDANGNPVYTGRGAPGAAPAAVAANTDFSLGARPVAQVPAPAAVAPVPIRGAQGAIIENPADSTAQKLQRALTSASVKGSPSTRAAIAQAILGEAGAAQAERATNLQAGREADQAGVQANLAAPERAADRRMQAQQINANLADSAAGRGAQLQVAQLQRRPTPITAADGTVGMASDAGQFTPVTGPDGKPVKTAVAPRQTGTLTQGDLLKSYDERYKAINTGLGTPEEKRAQQAALDSDPLYASLRGASAAGGGSKPSLEQFMGAARAANPGVSDDDLNAYYAKTYGTN